MREYAKKLLRTLRSPALGKIWKASAGERKGILLLSVMNMLSALLSLGFTLVMRDLVDAALGSDAAGIRNYALLLAGVIGVMLLSGYVQRVFSTKIRTRLLQNMRRDAMHQLLHKQYAAMQGYHSGELVNRVFSDVSVVTDGILGIVPPLLYLLIQLLGAAVILYRLNSGFMLILLVAGALGAGSSFLFRSKMKAFHKETQKAEDKLHARVQETLGNLRIIKASGTEARMEGEVARSQSQFSAAQVRRSRFSAVMGVGLGLVFRGSWFYALLWGCAGVYHKTFSYGTLTAILQLVGQIQSPFEGLISTMGTAYGAVSSEERLMELFSLPDETPQPVLTERPDRFREIRLEKLGFSYLRDEEVLHGINLTIRAGDTMAIMGQSGCGKSTLFSLLLGIYDPARGSVHVDLGETTTDRTVRALFAYVPQGNALFSGTIRENIGMFRESAPTDEELWRAAELACIDGFIRGLDRGMDTEIGERGLGLSEGQAQRVAIARALLLDAPVLLLDEATSALDEQTEARVLKNIAALEGRTCLIVTHRRAALDICNRSVRLRDGYLEECEPGKC